MRELAINITTGLLLLAGVVSMALPMAFASARAELPWVTAHALLLLAAAWFLYKRRRLSVLILAASASAYLVGGLLSASASNLSMSALMPAFYWSTGLRVSLVVFVLYLLSERPSGVGR